MEERMETVGPDGETLHEPIGIGSMTIIGISAVEEAKSAYYYSKEPVPPARSDIADLTFLGWLRESNSTRLAVWISKNEVREEWWHVPFT